MNQVRQASLLSRRPLFYVVCISVNVLLLVAGWTAFTLLGDSWWQLGTAVFLAGAFAQNGFLTHDAGHRPPYSPGVRSDHDWRPGRSGSAGPARALPCRQAARRG